MNNDVTKPFDRFWALLKPDSKDISDIYLFAIIGGVLSLGLPLGIQAIINFIQAGKVSTSWFLLVGLVVSAIGFSGYMNIAQLRITESLQQRIFARSSLEFATRIPKIQLRELLLRYAPEWTNRFFDTLTIQKGISKLLIDFTAASLQIIFGLILLSFYHPFFIIFGFALLLLLVWIFRMTAKRGFVTSLQESKYKYKVANWLEEIARNRMTFKHLGSGGILLKRTDDYLQGYLKSRDAHFKVLVQQYIYLIGFKVLIALALLIIGGLLVLNQQMNIGQFVAAEIIIVLVLNSVEKLIVSLEMVYDVLTAIEKIGEITDLPLDTPDGLIIEKTDALTIEIDQLEYLTTWSRNPLLSNLSCRFEAGKFYHIQDFKGNQAQGLFLMIAAMALPNKGQVLINGVPTSNLQPEKLRAQIASLSHHDQLIYGTVLENIVMGRNYTIEQVLAVATAVGLDRHVLALTDAYQTVLNPEASTLDRQLITLVILCRALIARPAVLLWDTHNHYLPNDELEVVLNHLQQHYKGTVLLASIHENNLSLIHEKLILC
jgi:ABC-type bacteriocin/lantibiotic exporter with double-glycine peptidase domain